MKIGLSTAAFYGKWEVEEAAALLGRYGADCAEVFLQTRERIRTGICAAGSEESEWRAMHKRSSVRNGV